MRQVTLIAGVALIAFAWWQHKKQATVAGTESSAAASGMLSKGANVASIAAGGGDMGAHNVLEMQSPLPVKPVMMDSPSSVLDQTGKTANCGCDIFDPLHFN